VFRSLPSLQSMKIKPSTMLLGLGSIVLVAYVVTGASYLKQRMEQPGLTEQVTSGGVLLANLGNSQKTLQDLKDQLEQLQASQAIFSRAMPTSLDSAALVKGLLTDAAQRNVRITQITGLPPKEVKGTGEEARSYETDSYALVADGALSDLFSFLHLIEGDTTQTAGIGDVALAPTENRYEVKFTASFYASAVSADASATPQAPVGQQANPSGG
jgi:hypothetical protein